MSNGQRTSHWDGRKATKGLLPWGNFPSYGRPGHRRWKVCQKWAAFSSRLSFFHYLTAFAKKILQQIWRLTLGLIAWIKQDLKLETKQSWAIPMLFSPLPYPISPLTTVSSTLDFSVGLSYITFQTCHIRWAIYSCDKFSAPWEVSL